MIALPIVNIGVTALVALALPGVGLPIVRYLTRYGRYSPFTSLMSFICGTTVVGTITGLAAVLKLLSPTYFFGLTGVLVVAAIFHLVVLIKSYTLWRTAPQPETVKISWTAYAVLALIIIVVGAALCMALMPPHYKDELVYHLEAPKQIIHTGGVTLFTDNILAYFPMLTEMLYAVLLFFKLPIAARTLHWLFGLVTITCLFQLQRRSVPRTINLLLCALFFSVPSFFQTASLAYVDIAYVCYLAGALLAAVRWLDSKNGRMLILTGICVAAMVSTKYLGLQALIFFNFFLLAVHRKNAFALWLRDAVMLNTPVILISSLWFIKNLYFTGNPLFPFFYSLFPSSPEVNWDSIRMQNYMNIFSLYGFDPEAFVNNTVTMLDRIIIPIRLSFMARFEDAAFFDGVIGPAWIVLAALIPFGKDTSRKRSFFTWALLCFFIFWFFGSKQVRFLFPTLVLLNVTFAFTFHSLPRILQRASIVVIVIGIAYNTWIDSGLFTKSSCVDVLTGNVTVEQHLERKVTPYHIMNMINETTPDDAVIFLTATDNLNFYLEREYITDYVFTRDTLLTLLTTGDLLTFFTMNRVSYILFNDKFIWNDTFGLPPELNAAFFHCLKENTTFIASHNGYSLYKLN